MYRYVIKRLLLMIPVIIGVSFLVFFIMDMAPGDAVDVLAPEGATAEDLEAIRHDLGLDKPVVVRYIDYMAGMLHGDLGVSYISKTDVFQTYVEKLPATIKLSFASILISVILSVPLGIYSATRQGTIQDNISMAFAMIGLAMPHFWLGLLLIIVFSLKLQWFPSGGDQTLSSIVLPAITIGTGLMATLTRTTRSSMLDVLKQEYLRTARAKGIPEKVVVMSHALRNALIPTTTVIGLQMGGMLGGSVLTESVFAWPGIGRYMVQSIQGRDIPSVMGCIIIFAISFALINLLVDLIYGFIDPRIKAQYK